MSQVRNEAFEGDVSVGGKLTTGDDLMVRGGGTVKGSLRVEGWLDAPNVMGPSKGVFSSAADLLAAYPEGGRAGWWAVVGEKSPGRVWLWSRSGWRDSGVDFEFSVAAEGYAREVEELRHEQSGLSAEVGGLRGDVEKMSSEMKGNFQELEVELADQKREMKGLSEELAGVSRDVQGNYEEQKVELADMKRSVDSLSGDFCERLLGWALAGSADTEWPEVELRNRGVALRRSGKYADVNGSEPYFVCGVWVSESEMMKAVMERYTPYMGGVQSVARVNVPVRGKSSDSSLTLDYAATNNGNLRALVLGAGGWEESIRPISMKRAVDGCYNLQAVIGEIDMTSIQSAWAANSLFRSCPNLWQFHLANIPDVIETLDLTGVSDSCIVGFATERDGREISSLKWLVENFTRDIRREKQLVVKVSKSVFAQVSDDLLYAKGGISWAMED